MRLSENRTGRLAVVAGAFLTAATGSAYTTPEAAAERRSWIEEMKGAERGPFSRIRWFCKDGALLPPTPSACVSHGGGWQHGEWSARTTALRAQGYLVANVLAGLDMGAFVAEAGFPEAYAQILVERFLVGADNGWIYRRAQYYRGAVQSEDERDGARALLLAMLQGAEWTQHRYPALRAGARLLPHGKDTASIQQVRDKAAALAALDPTFARLRAKIHGTPEARDAASVREHSARSSRSDLAPQYEALAAEIDRVYSGPPLPERLEQDAAVLTRAPWLQEVLRASARGIATAPTPAARYTACASLLRALRDALPRVSTAPARLRLLDLSLAAETEAFRIATELPAPLLAMTRAERLSFLASVGAAAYGTGHLNGRLRGELMRELVSLSRDTAPLGEYLAALKRMSLAPGWGTQALRYHFEEGMVRLTELDPQADLFIQDQLRGSPLLLYAQVLDGLLRDANRLAGVQHKLYGRDVGVGLSALNPGLARGILNASPNMARLEEFRADGIYVLPETVADLPPLGGILTAGAGNPLSHVQLLARNFGIPNVAVDEDLLAEVRKRDSQRVVLAVSPGGVVEVADDSPSWNAAFADPARGDGIMIRPDLQKLDLTVHDFVPLELLRASDSGRIVGPKAAKLGELRRHFPEAVSRGVAIPFGLFREAVLDRPYAGTGLSTYEWMASRFRAIEAMPPDSPEREAASDDLRAHLFDLIRTTDLGAGFRGRLRAAMEKTFGPGYAGGVFVRSDTNVEDLPGFTGAGLNLTLPHVVGFDAVADAIREVWASPFTARAFAWRQGHMKDPENVYPAVLLLETVPSDVSGVMVTQGLESGDPNVLSVAVNEGMGGAVEGQAAESLRIDTRDGSVRALATATAPWRYAPRPEGGVAKLRTSGSEALLGADEVRQLIRLSRDLPARFPAIVDDEGKPTAADVEFAFVAGKLHLLQIRPFLESRRARASVALQRMDDALRAAFSRTVQLGEVPPP